MFTSIRFALLLALLLSWPLSSLYAAAPEPMNQIIKLTERGLEPPTLHINRVDGIVFFLNSTATSLATLEIDYGAHPRHCASENLSIGPEGKVHSTRPFGPRDFAGVCFPEPGSYPVTIYGVSGSPHGMQTLITVE